MMQEIPNFHYFKSKNPFSGSRGKLRYRIEPVEEGLQASAWVGPNCMEKTDDSSIRRQQYELSEDGLQAAVNWLDQIYHNGEQEE